MHDALATVAQDQRRVEIQEHAERLVTGLEIAHDLAAMNWVDRLDRFDLEQNGVLDDKVHPDGVLKAKAVEYDVEPDLLPRMEPLTAQGVREGLPVNGFAKARPKFAVDPKRSAFDRPFEILGRSWKGQLLPFARAHAVVSTLGGI